MRRWTVLPGAVAALAAAPAPAQDALTGWDLDRDQEVTREEFRTGIEASGIFDAWDAGGDGVLTAEEVMAGSEMGADLDRSGDISESEALLTEGWVAHFGEWDTDQSQGLTRESSPRACSAISTPTTAAASTARR